MEIPVSHLYFLFIIPIGLLIIELIQVYVYKRSCPCLVYPYIEMFGEKAFRDREPGCLRIELVREAQGYHPSVLIDVTPFFKTLPMNLQYVVLRQFLGRHHLSIGREPFQIEYH